MRTLLILGLLCLSLFANKAVEHNHMHKHADCEKPIIFDETELDKVFELKGKIYKILKGDDVNPTLLYVLDPQSNKFIQIKQK